MSEIFAITFSKDRAMQLELLLESIKDHVEPGLIKEHWILLKSTDQKNALAYRKLQQSPLGKEVKWLVEGSSSFQDSMKKMVEYFRNKNPKSFVMFFTDDDIVYRPTGPVKSIVEQCDPKIHLGVSIRHDSEHEHKHVRQDPRWSPGEPICPDWTRSTDDFVEWQWTTAKFSPWNYPFSVEGHIYPLINVYPFIVNGIYLAPNSFESFGTTFCNSRPTPTLYLATKHGSIFGNSINKIQSEWEASAGYGNIFGTSKLTDLYLDDFIFDKERVYKLPVSDVHCIFEDEGLLIKR
jgi:hypothetical protein